MVHPKGKQCTRPEGYRGPTLEPGLGLGLNGERLWTHQPQDEHEGSGAVWTGRQTKAEALAVRSSVMEIGFWNMERHPSGVERAGACGGDSLVRRWGSPRSSERVASLRLRVGERVLTRLRIQAAEMSFLPREAGLRIRDRVRSSDIREGLGVEPLLLHIERRLSGEITSLTWLGSGWGSPRRADGSGRGEGCLGTLLKLLPPQRGSG
ncbi:hypothetical protein D4764_15G0005650 [Takifugu flavidus]|uniref:Uncharacterized protein n=1 Tax=Takifugu flavidus TaxID=433684 RepID=A0A5C6P321_9TELE|nr:hypothetical protein D4764_15G0005650 [Takifugu flavidus]